MSLFRYVRMFASNRQKSEDAAEVFERAARQDIPEFRVRTCDIIEMT
jgi:hypothetical protein